VEFFSRWEVPQRALYDRRMLSTGTVAGSRRIQTVAIAVTTWTTFNPCFLWIFLGGPYLVKIVDLEVAKVIERVRGKGIKVQMDRSAVEFLIDKGYDPTYGARPMRRAVEKFLEDPLAEEFLRGNIQQGDTLEVHAAGEQLALKMAVAGAK
jgi:C-terminal, D2-small domain, of ClpB protein